ncbi:MAG: nitrogen fixation protein FixF [Pseudomonadota bacterium]
MTRFAAITTQNTNPLIAALGSDCDILDPGLRVSGVAHDDLALIAARNAKRRQIRYPQIFGNPIVERVYKNNYARKLKRQYAALHRQLSADTTRTVIIFNGFLAPNAVADVAARDLGMRRLYVENGYFPGTLQADPQGINGLSSLPRSPDFYDGLAAEELGDDWPDTFEIRTSKLRDDGGRTALPKSFVFVPFQVPSDMQILALSPWIRDMEHLFAQIRALALSHKDQHFVIKEHPSFPRSIQRKVDRPPNVHFANHAVTRDLLEACDAVITVNSTVGLEALVLGKKVITLGEAHYAIDGLVLRAEDEQALTEAFSRLAQWKAHKQRREKFIRFVHNRFLIPGDRRQPTAGTISALQGRATGIDAYSKILGGFLHAASPH